jgi:hypothetical protein
VRRAFKIFVKILLILDVSKEGFLGGRGFGVHLILPWIGEWGFGLGHHKL